MTKNAHAQKLGSLGGHAAAKSMNKAERRARALKAVKAREEKRKTKKKIHAEG